MRRKSVYIAGPMTGLKDFNFPAFMFAEKFLKAQGYEVCNPAANAIAMGDVIHDEKGVRYSDDVRPLQDILALDIVDLAECGAIFMLPGWEKSGGAKIEHAFAVYTNKKIIYGE